MPTLMTLLVLITAFFIYFVLQRKSSTPNPSLVRTTENKRLNDSADDKKRSNFRGIILIPDKDCCSAVSSLSNITFSSSDNIRLPLTACDKQNCLCDTKQIRERRNADRRRVNERRNEIRFNLNNPDRREHKGRRTGDNTWSGGYIS
ncbi:hypothetical protein [Amphritea sp.]|uniref:hypothetical protein n=1 Tax=Amphritea sp. TaxID=1872502 RepID=UPI0025C37043|nr:hypothetical protein [Amphritea sp.]